MEGRVTELHRRRVLDLISYAAAAIANDAGSDSKRCCLTDETCEALWNLDSRYYEFSEQWKAEMISYFASWQD